MRFPSARTRLIALAVASALLLVVTIARLRDPMQEGLTATFFADSNWSSAPVAAFVDPRPSTASFGRAFGRNAPEVFSATWLGTLLVLRDGAYEFATVSDDVAWVYIDDALVVDDGGRHSALKRTGSIRLGRGGHRIMVKYAQYGGDAGLTLSWARDGRAAASIEPELLFPRSAPFARLMGRVAVRWLARASLWIWLAAVVLALTGAAQPALRRLRATARSDQFVRALVVVVGVSVVLNAVGLWWGVPSEWAGDEIGPITVLNALEHRFTGGWFDRYPPLQMQLLGAVFAPWLILKKARLLAANDITEYGVLLVLSRLVTVVAAAGTIVALYRAGREAFGTRAAILAAAALTVLTPFLYYAKTANPEVPYVFWLAVSLVYYLRLIRTPTLRDGVGFALAATLSICTKDQAYGLYILTPLPLLYRLWESHRDEGDRSALRRALFDRRLWIPFATAVAIFALVHNIPLNPRGFVTHVRDITGAGQEGYQMVNASWSGRLSLIRIVADLNQRSWGWPLWLVSMAGVCVAAWDRSTRRATIVLLTIVVSYYFGFINVIRYAFDRYLLPVCLIEALFIGVALDRLLLAAAPTRTAPARAFVAAAFTYTALYAVTLDFLMVRDARYAAERWLTSRDAAHRLVGFMFPATVLPRLQPFAVAEIKDVASLRSAQPEFFLLNADYARAVPTDRPEAQLASGLQRGTLGYTLAFRYRAPVPWPWLPSPHPNLVGPRDEMPVLSVLTQVNPTIEIYERDGRGDGR